MLQDAEPKAAGEIIELSGSMQGRDCRRLRVGLDEASALLLGQGQNRSVQVEDEIELKRPETCLTCFFIPRHNFR